MTMVNTRVVRMRVSDAVEAGYMMPGWKTEKGAEFVCPKCGHRKVAYFFVDNRQLAGVY